jgi:HEAT repeat protein
VKLVVTVIVVALETTAWAQPPRAAGATVDRTAAALGRGWSALGLGQSAKAVEVARQLLKSEPGNHDAAALAVAAHSADRRPIAALDEYEKWLQASATEDIFIMRTIATATLRTLAASPEPRIKIAALSAMAEAGDRAARQALVDETTGANPTVEADAALAELGDREAIGRLETMVTAGGPRDKSAAIDALRDAGSKGSAAAIAAALKDPAPPSRMSAARALADLGATDAIPALRETLQDEDPAVRTMASIALTRLGAPEGGMTLESLEKSPVGQYRLLAATAAATQNPSGTWELVAESLLTDPDPLVRVKAAALLLEHGRKADTASAVLSAGMSDPSPAVRTSAAKLVIRSIQKAGAQDLPTLRLMLRDRLPDIQVAAASGVLRGHRGERPQAR